MLPAGLGALASFACSGADQLALELGQAAQHGGHQAALSGRRVGPGIAERAKARTLARDGVEDVEQLARRSGEMVEARHHEHVAGGEPVDRATKLWAIGDRARSSVAENSHAAGRAQSLDVSVEGSASGRGSSVAVDGHARTLMKTAKLCKYLLHKFDLHPGLDHHLKAQLFWLVMNVMVTPWPARHPSFQIPEKDGPDAVFSVPRPSGLPLRISPS
jgi:hypothetical protein